MPTPFVLFGLTLACAGLHAQTTLGTSLDTSLGYVVDSRYGGLQGGDFVTQIRPGFQLASRSGRVRGSLSYSLNAIHHSASYQTSELQNFLSGSGVAELIEGWAFVDGLASVSQRSLSAFGQQSAPGSVQANENRVETASLALSPYVRGGLGSVATYEARVSASIIDASKSETADSTNASASVAINSASRGALLGWGVLASKQRADFKIGRSTENDRISLSLTAVASPELTLVVRGGHEITNVVNLQRTSYDNYGGEVRWTPTERTVASLAAERRYFGPSYQFSFEHRFPLSSVRISSSLSDSTNSDPVNGVGQPVTLYDLFFSRFASVQPDPVLRDILVRDFLSAQGLDPNSTVGGGSLSSTATLVRRTDIGWSYSGRRLTLTLQAFTSDTSRLGIRDAQPGDLITERGYTAYASHRLTPTASISLSGSLLTTLANDNFAGSELKSLSLGLTEQVGRRTTAALTARYSVFNSAITPYREAAVTASLGMRF